MERVQIFSDENPDVLQEKINDWLSKRPTSFEIKRVLQSESAIVSCSYTTISIFYCER